MKKNTRGTFERVPSKVEGIIIASWVDNSVRIASTGHGVSPVSSVQWYSQTAKKKIKVPPAIYYIVSEHHRLTGVQGDSI
ncbi:UNVERIFIED_CONTAM: hypothetical protein FKN15_054910 [Acipenser sinensis]